MIDDITIVKSRTPKNWSFSGKQDARRETIIDAYRRAFVGQRRLPAAKQYWTMAGRQAEGGEPLVGGEVHQVLESGLITPEQYRGVDIDAEALTANREAWPGLEFIEDDFFDAMNSAEAAGEFDPGVINLDTFWMTGGGRRSLTHALSRILNLLEGHDGVLLVVNGVAKNWVRKSGGYDEVLGQVWDLLDGGRWSQVPLGERRERVYEYTGKAASTTMCTMALCKGGTGVFSEPRPEGGVTTLKYTDPITLRPMQKEAFRALRREPLRMLSAMTGSGKTLVMQAIALDESLEPGRKVLIAAPQRDIGMGFRRCRIRVGRRVLVWNLEPTGLNLCDDPADSVDEVYRFLLRAPAAPGNAVMVCCHQSLTLAWERIRREGLEPKAIRNLSLWIDEAHRVMSPGSEDGDGNALGRAIGPMLRTKSRSARLGLVTATPCRGDGMPIVCEANLTRFAKFECDLERHWRENLPSIDSFSYDFVTHHGFDSWEFGEKLRSVLSDRMRTLVYVPAEGRGSEGGKASDLRLVLEAIEAAHPGADVVDLCTPATQKANQRALVERLRSDEPDDPDYVVAVNMMKMGSDWPNLQRVVDLKPARSRPDAAQRFGRLTREPRGGAEKRHISYVSFIEVEDEPDGDKLRGAVSAKFAELVAVLLLKLDVVAGRLPGRRRHREFASNDPDFLNFAFAAMEEMEGEANEEGKLAAGVAQELLDELMDRRGVPEDKRPAYRRTVFGIYAAMMGNASELVRDGFDMMSVSMSGMRRFLTGALGRGVFARFREAYRRTRFTEEQVVTAIIARMESEPGWRPSNADATQIPGLPLGTSCQRLETAIRRRYSGFTREGDSLIRMLRRNGVLPPKPDDLTEEQVVEAIKAHMRNGSGWIPKSNDTTQIFGLPDGTNCEQLDRAIRACSRGFMREGDTLLKMLRRHEVLPPETPTPNLTEEIILEWARDYQRLHSGKLPTSASGTCKNTSITWGAINKALMGGYNGLPSGSSLSQLFIANGLKDPQKNLTELQIIQWAKEHRKRTRKLPSMSSGAIPGTKENWQAVDAALRQGRRGLGKIGGLTALYRKRKLRAESPDHTEEIIAQWVREHQKRHDGELPCSNSGVIPGAAGVFGTPEKWHNIDVILRKGGRGLEGGSSLSDFLKRHEFRGGRTSYTEDDIVRWAEQHFEKKGKWPTDESGKVHPTEAPDVTWQKVGATLRFGCFGFKGGSSIHRLLEKRGFKKPWPTLTREMVIRLAKKHERKHKRLPAANSGVVDGIPKRFRQVLWSSIDDALRIGKHGLNGGSSLSKLLTGTTGKSRQSSRPRHKPNLSVNQVVEAIMARIMAEPGWRPSCTDITQIPGLPPGTNCRQLNLAINGRLRGFTRKGDSLHKMLQRKLPKAILAPPFSVRMLTAAAKAVVKETGDPPTQNSGTLCLPPGKRWDAAYKWLARRGIPMSKLHSPIPNAS